MKYGLITLLLVQSMIVWAQPNPSHDKDRKIHFPDVPGFQTIVTDFHIHTVFSDGSVWPNIRVQEALEDGLDAISLTEHLEYQPHLDDIPHPDRNRSYELGEKFARPHDLLMIPGSEITRSMPPGHNNALFIQDANKLLDKDSLEVFREAKRQGAFVFWNHANWIVQNNDGVARLTDMHRLLIEEDLLHGIEVVNQFTFSDEALQIAIDNGLTIMGTSDVHSLIDWEYHVHDGGHRPVTLVLAREKTAEAIKDGLIKGRTIVWFNNQLIGLEQWLQPLMKASLTIEKARYMGISSVAEVFIHNDSDVEYLLMNESAYKLHDGTGLVQLLPNATTKISLKILEQLADFELTFRVLNAVTAPDTNPVMTFDVKMPE